MNNSYIMIVEDERITAMEIQSRLKKKGYSVSAIASSGAEAIEQAQKFRPDIALMDIHLKGDMDGVQTAEILRRHFDIPVIYISAYADKDILERAKLTEPFGYVLKPIDNRELDATIEVALYKHEIERDLNIAHQQLKASEQRLRASEQQLRASNQQLKADEKEREKLLDILFTKNKELQSIIHIVSHDLKTPLVNIDGFSKELADDCKRLLELMQDATFSEDKAYKANALINEYLPESLQFITASTNKIHILLDGMVQVSRIGDVAVDIEPLDMNKMVEEIIKTVQFNAKECDAVITADNLPGCLGDNAMINQVFSNLIGNALKYLDKKRKGKIHISGRILGQMSIYCVEDNGIGIAPEHHDEIFKVFCRLNAGNSADGEGLGLSIAMRILSRLNGTIRVESEPGKASRFFVSLPKVKI